MNQAVQTYFSDNIRRYDDDGIIKYYHYTDFPGLKAERFSFHTPRNHTLIGYVYAYSHPTRRSIVVLSHGLGGGHRSYMQEIVRICREGYRVAAFDNVGCFESDGESILGITEAVYDLNCCLDFLKTQNAYRQLPVILLGHSWGAYAVLTCLHFHKDITKCVALACFNSVDDFLSGYIHMENEDSKNEVLAYERNLHPDIADLRLTDVLGKTKVPTLLLASEDDFLVPPCFGMQKIQKATDNPHLHFMTLNGKKHLPQYTQQAVDLLYTTFGEYTQKIENGELDTKEKQMAFMQKADWDKITQQDEPVWQTIFRFLAE